MKSLFTSSSFTPLKPGSTGLNLCHDTSYSALHVDISEQLLLSSALLLEVQNSSLSVF